MSIAFMFGRIFLSIIFIVAGVQKLMNVQAVAKMLADNGIPIPEQVEPYLAYVGNIPKFEALGYLVGGLEVLCGLMVMIGLKARWGALVLIVYAACSIFFVHHFWDMEGAVAATEQEQALLYLSVLGGLLLLVAATPTPTPMDRP